MNPYQKYSLAKVEWLKANPGATPEQIEQACKVIAQKLGV
jgi:hypothetical protein